VRDEARATGRPAGVDLGFGGHKDEFRVRLGLFLRPDLR